MAGRYSRLIIFAATLLFCVSSLGKYSGGTGEPNDPYLIATPNDLNSIGLDPCDWDKHFLMTADINMAGFTGTQFNMIGNSGEGFTGVFDGNGHSIQNFTYSDANSNDVGLFGEVYGEGTCLKNITLIDVNVLGNLRVGALVGHIDGTVSRCSVVHGTVKGDWAVGGLAGYGHSSASSYNVICDCYTDVDVEGNDGVGGVIGYSHTNLENCFSAGSVKGENLIGGLTGALFRLASASNCYSLSNVEGNYDVGGLIGTTACPVANCFSAGIVDGNDLVGAFVGSSPDDIYTKCFWDTELNLDVNGVGNLSDLNVIGLPTEQMQKRNTFIDAEWDMINVWDIGENQTYPFLRTHLPSDINKDNETNLVDLAILAEHWLRE